MADPTPEDDAAWLEGHANDWLRTDPREFSGKYALAERLRAIATRLRALAEQLAAERAKTARAEADLSLLRAEVSAAFDLPPAIGPVPGEMARIFRDMTKRAEKAEAETARLRSVLTEVLRMSKCHHVSEPEHHWLHALLVEIPEYIEAALAPPAGPAPEAP